MTTFYAEQNKNNRKTWLLMTIFFCLIVGLGYLFSDIYGNPNILYFCIIFSLIMNFASYWYSDKIALSLAKAHPATREKYFDFYNLVENLSITAGLPMPKIYVIEDSAPNAFATGRDKKHAVIAVTTGLLAIMNKTELEGVVAHEMSHIGNKDILLATVVIVLVGFVSILSDMMLRISFFRSRGDRNSGSGLIVILSLILAILAPLASSLIQLAISRKREYLADAGAALLTRYPEGLASALEKLRDHGKPMQAKSTAIAHLYISDPRGEIRNRKIKNIFATHPPIEDRIKRLRGVL
jgi:heat shock protein HtpX